MSIKDYVERFGNYRTQIIREVYHKCGICQEELLLDGDELHKHSRKHNMLMSEYNAKFINSCIKPSERNQQRNIEDNREIQNLKQIINTNGKKTETIVPKEKGVWETIQDIENILDSFSRSSR